MSESKVKRPFPPPVPAATAPVEAAASPPVAAPEIVVEAAALEALPPPPRNPFDSAPDTFAIFDAAREAWTRGATAAAGEMAEMSRAGFATVTEATSAAIGATTLSDAIEVNARFFRKSVETWLAGCAHLTEIGSRFAADALRPLSR